MDGHGTIVLQSFPTCPECEAPWETDHRSGGRCPGRPEGCTCRCDLQYHLEPQGCTYRREGPCWCPYRRRPVNWATHDGDYAKKWGS